MDIGTVNESVKQKCNKVSRQLLKRLSAIVCEEKTVCGTKVDSLVERNFLPFSIAVVDCPSPQYTRRVLATLPPTPYPLQPHQANLQVPSKPPCCLNTTEFPTPKLISSSFLSSKMPFLVSIFKTKVSLGSYNLTLVK